MSNNENTKAAVLTQIVCDGASARSQAQVTFSVPVGINLGDSAATSRILSSGGFEIHKQARGMGLRRAEALVFQCDPGNCASNVVFVCPFRRTPATGTAESNLQRTKRGNHSTRPHILEISASPALGIVSGV